MKRFGLDHYDKWDFVIATKANSPIKPGNVYPIDNRECPFEDIHAIEEIVEEYQRTIG